MTDKQPHHENGAGEFHEEARAEEPIGTEAAAAEGGVTQSDAASAAFDDQSGALPAEPTAEQVIEQLQLELAAERARYEELFDKFQRAAAEFQNSRRRQEMQTANAIERASTQMIRRLLPMLDDLELAFESVPTSLGEDQVGWVEGFRQIQRKLQGLLADEGVNQIASDGEFDPTRHEAVSSEVNADVPSGHIISTLRTGYEQQGHVLRPALVRVAA